MFCVITIVFTMGIKLIILLGLLIGVLYCIHILVKDYQAVTASKVLRFIFKRDTQAAHITNKAKVRWSKILHYDSIQCTRYIFCDLGAQPASNQLRADFIHMLTLEPREEDAAALDIFKNAYLYGKQAKNIKGSDPCRSKYSMCPFQVAFLYEVIQYLLRLN